MNTHFPKQLSTRDYEECVELVRKEAQGNPTIRALYLMGGPWSPGISDLDIVVVYKNGIAPQYLKSPWSLGEKARFIFTHRYLSFNEDTARLFYFLYPKQSAQLRLLSGEQILFSEPTVGEEQTWTQAFILFDLLINKLLLFQKWQFI